MREPRPKHVLVATRFNPLSGVSGTGTYLFSILDYLHRNGFKITVCWSERPAEAARRGWWMVPANVARTATLQMPGALCLGPRLRVFPDVWTGPLRTAIRRWGKSLFSALGLRKPAPGTPPAESPETAPVENPYRWDRPPDPYEYKFFGNAVAQLKPGTVFFNYCWMTPLANRLPAGMRTATITYDLRHLYSVLVDGEIRHVGCENLSRELETEYLRRGDLTVAIREDDAALFREMLPGKEVVSAIPSNTPRPSTASPIPGRCLFIAAENEANREGIAWFLGEVWPQIRQANASAELHLCGTICKVLPPGNVPGVIRRGFVDDIAKAYGEASVVIVPLLSGSGVKIKLMEAVAYGKACVSTPIGAEGVPALGECVRIAGKAAPFAEAVADLLADPRAREALERRAQAAVRTHFSAETCYRPLLEALEK
jgi:hypothetical protein